MGFSPCPEVKWLSRLASGILWKGFSLKTILVAGGVFNSNQGTFDQMALLTLLSNFDVINLIHSKFDFSEQSLVKSVLPESVPVIVFNCTLPGVL